MFPKYVFFINSCIRPSPILGVRENFHSTHPSGVYTFFQKPVMISEFFFQRKAGSHLFSQACCFLARQPLLFFIFYFFSSYSFLARSLFFHEVFCYLNICIFLWGIMLYTCVSKVSCYLNIHIYILWSIFCYIHAYPRYLST